MGSTPTGFVNHATVHMTAGSSLTLEFSILDEAGSAVPLNLTDAKWQLVVPGASPIEKTLGAGVILTDSANGLLEVLLTPADTSGLSGVYYDELQLEHIDGRIDEGAAFGLINIRAQQQVA